MKFEYTGRCRSASEKIIARLAAILPASFSWSVLLGIILLCMLAPVPAVISIIVLNFYWMLRLTYMTLFLLLSYGRLHLEKKTDWMARIRAFDRWEPRSKGTWNKAPAREGIRGWISEKIYRAELKMLAKSEASVPPSEAICHLVIIPIIHETAEVVEPGIESIVRGDFPSRRMIVILAVEERAPAEVKEAARALREKYLKQFLEFFVVFHPDGVPGEARVKGANVTHAAKFATEYFRKHQIAAEHVIVSCFDADTVVSANYFSCLTYCFLASPNRDRSSFQPMPVFNNNIWDVPSFARVLEMGASFLQLTEATHSEKLVTFSSHSMSFRALEEVGYWPVDMISDDSAIFWKALIHYDGDYRVVPMYTTLSMDAACAGTRWETMKNIYKQKRRWAWGIENFPIVIRAFLKNRKMTWPSKISYLYKLIEVHISWATCPFILAFIGWVPILLSKSDLANSVLYYNAPRITGTLFNIAWVSFAVTILLSLALLPDKKIRYPVLRRIRHAFEWFLIPVVAILLSAVPALDAQTRLMLGQRMEFYVTQKTKLHDSGHA
ncbi:MAG: glycosyltransferase [Candidatus Omnitrophota bacterium]